MPASIRSAVSRSILRVASCASDDERWVRTSPPSTMIKLMMIDHWFNRLPENAAGLAFEVYVAAQAAWDPDVERLRNLV